MIIPVPVNGTSILPACRQQSFQSPCVLFLLTPYIQFFRKFCQFQLQSMYGIHSLLPPLWAHPGPVHPRLSSLGPLPQPHRPSVPPLTTQLSFSQETRRSLRTPESGQIPPSLAQNLPLVPHVKVKERRKGCWGVPCPGPAVCLLFFFLAQLLKPLRLLGFQSNPQSLSSTS